MTGRPDESPHHAACVQAREEAAVSLLRHREPPAQVRSHLQACPPCREEYDALAALAPLLAGASTGADHPEAALVDGAPLLDRLVGQVRRRHRHRRLAVGLALAAVAAAAVPVVRLAGAGDPPEPVPPPPVVAAGTGTAADGAASAEVWVRERGTGSAVTVRVRGWSTAGMRCRIVVRDARGAATEAGAWTMRAPESAYTEEVDTPARDVRVVELVDDGSGRPLVDVPVQPA